MSLTRIISSNESVLDEVLVHLADVDLARSMVVFPGRRPSHFLRKALAGNLRKGFLPPKIFSYDEFVAHLSERELGIVAPDLDPLDAASLLFEIHMSQEERLGGDFFSTFDQFLPLGFRLFEEFEELMLARADTKAIQEQVGSLTFGNRHLLASYYDSLYSALREEKRFTRSLRLCAIAENLDRINFGQYERIVLAGFYALTPVDRQIFHHCSGLDQTVLVFQRGPGLEERLDALGWGMSGEEGDSQMNLFQERKQGPRKPAKHPVMHLVKSSDTHGQVFALSALLQSLLEKNEKLDERTVIVLPSSDALFPVLYQSLVLLPEDGYNISLGYPLARTPLYGMIRSLLDLVSTAQEGMLPTAAYTRFVLHPYIKNIRFGTRTDVTRVLFHALEEVLAKRPAPTVSLEMLESENALFKRVADGFSGDRAAVSAVKLKEHLRSIHDATIRSFLQPGTVGDFASGIARLVMWLNDETTAYLHPLFSRYAEKLITIAEKITQSGASGRRFEDVTSYGGFLKSYIGPQTVPFPGTPLRGVQVLGLLETRALSFDRVIILDASDDMLPGARGAEMVVPQGIRKKLGLETYRDREQLIEYYFSNLVSGAEEVHILYSENNKQERSRFVEKLIWEREQGKGSPENPVRTARYAIHLANVDPVPIEKSKAVVKRMEQFEFNATALDEYLKCQLRFYYHHVLRLKEREEVGDEVEPMDVGNLVHKILKAFFEPLKGKELRPEDLDDGKMQTLVHETVRETFGTQVKGSVFLLRHQTTSKLLEFLRDYQKKVLETERVTIVALEHPVSILRDGHHFSGRIDRVEERGGKTVILDYKTRQDDTPQKVKWKKFRPEDRGTWSEAIGSLQLPMYSLLYAEDKGKDIQEIVPEYIFLGRNYLDRTIETGLSKDGIVTETMHRNLHQVIVALAAEIKDPAIPFSPTEDLKKQCPGCPYQTICGTQWAREGRW